MSADLISHVVNQLSALIVEEAKLLGGLRQEIQHIVDELEHMKAFLIFADGRDEEEEDPRLKVWISQVGDVAYDIQDVVDEFRLRFGHSHNHGHGFSGHASKIFNSMKNLRARHRIAQELQGIKSRITSISESRYRYQSEYGIFSGQASTSTVAAVNNASWHHFRDDALLVEETKLVGIDDPKKQLISQLRDDAAADSQLKVVSVWGMGGLGKTVLVKRVQEDTEVRRQFQILAWVTVSQTWDMKELLKDLIRRLYKEIQKSVPEEVASISTTNELKEHVKEFLRDKRYLIVFDDVWDAHFWDAIKYTMPEGSCGGNRVMLTTRIEDVARTPNVEFQSYVHQMQPLSWDDSWTLLCKKTFKDNCCPAHLKDVAEAILRKCKGLPLGIVVIGGLLALKDNSKIEEWKMVERSLGSELEMMSGKVNPITKILSLSYSGLPDHLKTCLLYASIFPEDCQILEDRLIRIWIAEGFVLKMTGMTKYEVGRTYLADLTNRSLIQVTFNDLNPDYRVYHIHDLVREMILSKSSRQNFATIATGEQRSWPQKVRRLAIHDSKFDTKEESISFNHLRSLVIFKSNEPLSKSSLSQLLCGGCRLLKVLDLEDLTELEEIPEAVFKLFHLKTLSLRGTGVKVIPKFIGSLKNLEYLDLSRTEVRELPEEILKIEGLVHLVVFEETDSNLRYGFRGPKNIGKLVSLEWLYDIEANEIVIREIGELKKLKELGVTGLRREDGRQLCSSLAKLSNLAELYLGALNDQGELDLEDMNSSLHSSLQNLQRLGLWGCLERIPQIVPSLKGLTVIYLRGSRLTEDPLESLQDLPNLQSLILEQAFEGESLCFKAGCFLKLQMLSMERLESLRRLRVEEGAMPNLGNLEIESLKPIEEFPWGVEYLSKLQTLCLNDQVTEQLVDEDFEKIRHVVPKIWIGDEKDGYRKL